MAKKPVCLVCQKEMEKGFLTDLGHGGAVNLPRWCAGEPDPSFMAKLFSGEVDSSQHRNGTRIVAYRCPECEALRLYAPSAE